MAHSGTTVLCHLLQQHPDVVCCTNGNEAWLYENTWLPLEQCGPIQDLLHQFGDKRVLLKRPWNEVRHSAWMQREMPDAKFIYCYRDFADITASWSAPTSFVDDKLRNGTAEFQREHYKECWTRAQSFATGVRFFRGHYHADFEASPGRVIADLAGWLGLRPFDFDVSIVWLGSNIKCVLWHLHKDRQYG